MNYDMIIFDVDGTLWDVAEVTTEAANWAADQFAGVNKITVEDMYKTMGLGIDEIAKIQYPNVELSKAVEVIKLSIEITRDLINKKGGNIYDGVIDTIKYLSSKYKLAIVTNNVDDYAKLFIKKSVLDNCFVDYMGATTYGITKGEAIKLVASRNNAKKSCYIGDIKKDMDAAVEAGVDFIHAKYGFDKTLKSDLYIDDIKDLMKIL